MTGKAPQLVARQAELKRQYASRPELARQSLSAHGRIVRENLAFELLEPNILSPAGLHPSSGGDGSFACSVELLLASLASCAGVTCAAVANSMRIEWEQAEVKATGKMDFNGTLAVDRDAPVGLTRIDLAFDIKSREPAERIDKLIQLTERYCVVYQTLMSVPHVTVSLVEH